MSASFVIEFERLILKFYQHVKELDLPKNNFEKDKVGGFTLSNFKTYYNVVIMKRMWCWCRGTQISGIEESLDIESHT